MPWDKSKYPKDWAKIRATILQRANNCCELCGVGNHAHGYRDKNGKFWECEGMALEAASIDGEKIIKIVLTIAHWHDPDPMNVDPGNLKAACQRCHLRHDRELHRENRAKTVRAKAVSGIRENGLPGLTELMEDKTCADT
jgi:5-methylcytosine-specific restriction endonuclease McrA